MLFLDRENHILAVENADLADDDGAKRWADSSCRQQPRSVTIEIWCRDRMLDRQAVHRAQKRSSSTPPEQCQRWHPRGSALALTAAQWREVRDPQAGTFNKNRRCLIATVTARRARPIQGRRKMGRGILLWLLGVPIPVIILLALLFR